MTKNVEEIDFEPKVYYGDINIFDNIENAFSREKIIKVEGDYLIVKRHWKNAAFKRVVISDELIIERFMQEMNSFFENGINKKAGRIILIFEKEKVNDDDIEQFKGCTIFDKCTRKFFESIELVLVDLYRKIVYFDGLKKPVSYKHNDTRKMLINEMGFSEEKA